MSFRFHNTLTKYQQRFQPPKDKEITIYSCGPTVYDKAHIGNFRSYIFADILRRSLKLAGYKVKHAMNITDIDDKILNALYQKKKEPSLEDLKEYTQKYIQIFFKDLESLGIEKVEFYPRATEYIPAMISMVKKLIEKGIAYEHEDGVYFSIERFPMYGQLVKLDFSSLSYGKRFNIDEYSKEDVRDFALWKKRKKGESIYWEAPFGEGRPGWHLECSSMIESIFHDTIDIHTGGVDLIFPHHENEMAQTMAAYDRDLARFFLHCEHLLVDSRKMSKSLGNVYTLDNLLEKGYSAASLRYLLMSVHYRQKLNFTFSALEKAERSIWRIAKFFDRLSLAKEDPSVEKDSSFIEKTQEWKEDFLKALEEDLNTPRAFSVFHSAIHKVNQFLDQRKDSLHPKEKEAIEDAFSYMDQVLNFRRYTKEVLYPVIPEEIKELVEKRNKAREEKNYALADSLREEIIKRGYKVMDTPTGSRILKA